MPKISIIMPLYNSVSFLDEAIHSILNQTFTDWEFIIINEYGSNDGSKEVIEQYVKIDKRFILIQNETKLGISESMNIGLAVAKGEYIARMDADDISLPYRFEKQVNYLDSHPEIAMCGVKVEIFGSNSFDWKLETDSNKLSTNILFYSSCVHPTIMIRKAFLDKYKLKYNKNYKASEDFDLFARICIYGKVANLDEVLFRYRIMENNATFKNNDIGLVIYNEIMHAQFQRLNIIFNEDELKILSPHYSMKGAKGKEILIRLIKLDLLLKKILISNDKIKLYNTDNLMQTLHKRFKEAYDSISWTCSDIDYHKVDEIYSKSIFSHELFYHTNIEENHIVNPVVSVLLPAYNSEKYIIDTIWSILEQSFHDFELLIINEYGSDDNTVRIAEMFKDPRIKVVQNSSKLGLAESLNVGMRLAQGKYLARIDADDLCDKNRFKIQVEFLENNPEYGLCGAWQHHFGINTEWIHKCSITHEDIMAELLYNCDLCHSTLMLRKNYFIENSLFYDNLYAAEDYELWIRAIRVFKFANIPQVLGEYRVGEDNITGKKMDQLSLESGQLAARNITYYFNIQIPKKYIMLLSGWRNEIARLEKKDIDLALKFEKKLLRNMWEINEKKQMFNKRSLLKTINKRWRTVTNTWCDDGETLELDDLFNVYQYNNKNMLKFNKNQKLTIKRILKNLFGSIYRPIKYRTIDILQRQLWDLDGHLNDYKKEICNYIDIKLNKHEEITKKDINKETEELNKLNMRFDNSISEIDNLMKIYKQEISDTLNRDREDISDALCKGKQEIFDALSRNREDILKQFLNHQQLLSDTILSVIDARINQAENNIYEKIWAVEGNINNKINKIIDIQETQLVLDVDKNFKDNKVSISKNEKIKVAFLFQVASFWASFEYLWILLNNDDRFDATMLIYDSEVHESIQMKTARDFLQRKNIPFVDCHDYNFDIEKPHILFLQTPYDEWHRPKWLSSSIIKAKGIRIAYISYGIELLDTEELKDLLYQNNVINNAWKYYVISDLMKYKIQHNSKSGGYAVSVVGHTKFDSLYYADPNLFRKKINEKLGKRKIIVWLMHFPHHAIKDGMEVIDTPSLSEYEIFSSKLSHYKELYFIVRPHPKFFEMSKWIKDGEKITASIKNNIVNSENAYLDTDDEYHSMLKCGDAFIVDGSSLAVEVGALDKPVIYMKNKDNPIALNLAFKPLIDTYVQGETYLDIEKFLQNCIENIDLNKTERNLCFRSIVPYFDGKCAERIRDDFAYSIQKEIDILK